MGSDGMQSGLPPNARDCEAEIHELREVGGGSVMGWYAKGHHDRQAFAREATEQWCIEGWIPPAAVQQAWWRCVPTTDDWGYPCSAFHPANPRSRGAFPVTYTEHMPLEGASDGSARCSCAWCRKGRGDNPRYREQNKVMLKKEWLQIWRAACDRSWGFVWMTADHTTNRFPCYFIHWRDLDKCSSFLPACAERMGMRLPEVPEGLVVEHAA